MLWKNVGAYPTFSTAFNAQQKKMFRKFFVFMIC